MTRKSSLTRLFALAPLTAAALLAFGNAARAADLSFDYASNGIAFPSDSCGSHCLNVGVVGDSSSTSLGLSWAFIPTIQINTQTGLFSGSWSLTDYVGNNNLSGTLTGHVVPSTSFAAGAVNYLVTSGEGIFSGAKGSGLTSGTLTSDFSYSESGKFNLQVAAVPEPSTWAMMFIGIVGMTAVARRRRKGARL